MNIRPTVDFDDKYLNAKCKVIECIKALNTRTFAKEVFNDASCHF